MSITSNYIASSKYSSRLQRAFSVLKFSKRLHNGTSHWLPEHNRYWSRNRREVEEIVVRYKSASVHLLARTKTSYILNMSSGERDVSIRLSIVLFIWRTAPATVCHDLQRFLQQFTVKGASGSFFSSSKTVRGSWLVSPCKKFALEIAPHIICRRTRNFTTWKHNVENYSSKATSTLFISPYWLGPRSNICYKS